MFPLSKKFKATTFSKAFFLNAFTSAMIAATAVAMSSQLNDEKSYTYKYFNSVYLKSDLTSAHKMLIVFITCFFGAVIVSGFAGIAISQTISLSGIDTLGLVLIGLTAGFSVDYAVSKAKKVNQ